MRASDIVKGIFQRKPRYTLVDGKWYFRVREGYLLGPYDCAVSASKAVGNYIELYN